MLPEPLALEPTPAPPTPIPPEPVAPAAKAMPEINAQLIAVIVKPGARINLWICIFIVCFSMSSNCMLIESDTLFPVIRETAYCWDRA